MTLETLRITIPGSCPGKVRQNTGDKWKERECVVNYRMWRDVARESCDVLPMAQYVELLRVDAYYQVPDLWSQSKRMRMSTKIKRTKPDGDNVLGAVMDAYWGNDHALGDLIITRRWAEGSFTYVIIQYDVDAEMFDPKLVFAERQIARKVSHTRAAMPRKG